MRETDSAEGTATDARERIRERKRRELRERLEDGANGGAAGDADGNDPVPTDPIEVSGVNEFQSLLAEHDVVLVDCYADWCGPCQMMEPTVEALASDTDAVVATVDVDANQRLAQQLGARGVPTFIVYANGEPVDRFVGAQDRMTLESAIRTAVA